MYAANNCVFQYHLPENMQYMRNWNRAYLDFAKRTAGVRKTIRFRWPSIRTLCRSFRLAAQGRQRASAAGFLARSHRGLFRPTAVLVSAAGRRRSARERYPLNAITQRPMAMYHSWDSQNAWLRQIHSHNYLYVHSKTAAAAGISDGGWCWVESPGVVFDACCALAMRSSLERCGPGTRSARPRVHGNCHRTPMSRAKGSC